MFQDQQEEDNWFPFEDEADGRPRWRPVPQRRVLLVASAWLLGALLLGSLLVLGILYNGSSIFRVASSTSSSSPSHPAKDAAPTQTLFRAWMKKHGREYAHADEFQQRLSKWETNLRWIEETNSRNLSYKVAMNQFGDLDSLEFNSLFKGRKVYFNKPPQQSDDGEGEEEEQLLTKRRNYKNETVPSYWDWREHNAVGPVKNQGACGSCWTFSATGAIEAARVIHGGDKTVVPLSEQNLLDCSRAFNNHGCAGGLMDRAFKYIMSNGGIEAERHYPYEGEVGPCRYKESRKETSIKTYRTVPHGLESALQVHVWKDGPVSCGIDASHRSFQFYRSGVYHEPACSSIALDHAVLTVGFGRENGLDYWLVKNSWGTDWGEHGYMKLARFRNNNCGIATGAFFPIL
ncbi:Cathepsin H [Balamuthia mandrillaris]